MSQPAPNTSFLGRLFADFTWTRNKQRVHCRSTNGYMGGSCMSSLPQFGQGTSSHTSASPRSPDCLLDMPLFDQARGRVSSDWYLATISLWRTSLIWLMQGARSTLGGVKKI